MPTEFALQQNYPNPFNPQTTIRFDLPAPSEVTLVIYDMQGRVVRTLVNGRKPIGIHNVTWDGTNNAGFSVSSGLYLYRINAGLKALKAEGRFQDIVSRHLELFWAQLQ